MGRRKNKQEKRDLRYLKVVYGLEPPFRILVDGFFLQEAWDRGIFLRERLTQQLQGATFTLVVTRCVVSELHMLAEPFAHSHVMSKRMQRLPCPHQRCVASEQCFQDVVKELEPGLALMIGTQSVALRRHLKENYPRIPLIHIFKGLLTIEGPGKKSRREQRKAEEAKLLPDDKERRYLAKLEAEMEAEAAASRPMRPVRRIRKGPRQPNPLSTLGKTKTKKKKKTAATPASQASQPKSSGASQPKSTNATPVLARQINKKATPQKQTAKHWAKATKATLSNEQSSSSQKSSTSQKHSNSKRASSNQTRSNTKSSQPSQQTEKTTKKQENRQEAPTQKNKHTGKFDAQQQPQQQQQQQQSAIVLGTKRKARDTESSQSRNSKTDASSESKGETPRIAQSKRSKTNAASKSINSSASGEKHKQQSSASTSNATASTSSQTVADDSSTTTKKKKRNRRKRQKKKSSGTTIPTSST